MQIKNRTISFDENLKPKIMKANELRIGNIVQGNAIQADKSGIGAVEFTGQIFSISSVEPRIRINIDKLGLLYASDCMLSGVTLTEEILFKLGFKKNEFTSDKIESYYSLRLSDDKYVDLCLITDAGNCGIAYLFPYGKEFDFKYVHELQNLYFALTREELNVSELLK